MPSSFWLRASPAKSYCCLRRASSMTNESTQPKGSRPNPLGFLADEIAELKRQNLYRPMRVLSSAQGAEVVVDGARLVSLSSNNYLGLATHPRLVEAAVEATREFGAGSGAVRTIAGNMRSEERRVGKE